jgi:hypothetical protein
MTDKLISQLTEKTTPSDTDVYPLEEPATATKKITWTNMKLAIKTALGISAQMWLSANGITPALTNGCGPVAMLEMSTNKNMIKYVPFDPSTEQYGDFEVALPSDYGGGTITAIFHWTHPATTVNFGVVWGLKLVSVPDSSPLDAAYGTGGTATDTGGNTSYEYISPATGAITIAGTPAAGNHLLLRVYRKAADGSDTLAVNAYLLGVQLTYTRA